MPQTYVNDSAKQNSRYRIREFIGSNLDRDPSQIMVACFPGAEALGEAGLEITQIYDPLGIERENVVGLERVTKRAKRLKEASMGIQVENKLDFNYFQHTFKKFDVISLDYTSYFGDNQRYSLDVIAARGLLNPGGILVTNYYGAREQKETLDEIMRYAEDTEGHVNITDHIEALVGSYPVEDDLSLSKIKRSIGIQRGIASTLFLGKAALDPRISYPENIDLPFEEAKELFEHDINASSILGKNTDEKLARFPIYRSLNLDSMFHIDIDDDSLLDVTNNFIRDVQSYVVINHESLSYISNKGAPMYLDLWKLDNSPQEKIKDPNIIRDNQNGIEIPREFIGSGYKPGSRNPKITKEEAIKLLKCGISSKEIAKSYPNSFSARQLSSLKAHITMGTY